jgi:TolB protein
MRGPVLIIAFVALPTYAWADPPPLTDEPRLLYEVQGAHFKQDIYVAKLDGSGAKKLTAGDGKYEQPAWAPDGKKIACVSRPKELRQIIVMDADGRNATAITSDEYDSIDPRWSPDGKKIACSRSDRKSYTIVVMNADGSNAVDVSKATSEDFQPSWSPDGKTICFASNRSNGMFGVWRVDADGKNLKELTAGENTLGLVHPCWSPDGKRIVYVCDTPKGVHLFVVGADGKDKKQVTSKRGGDHPCWSKDGKGVVYGAAGEDGQNLVEYLDLDSGKTNVLCKLPKRSGFSIAVRP